MSKQKYFNEAYSKAKSQGYNSEDSIKIAEKCLNDYNPRVSGKKSFSLDTSNYDSGNILDVLVGYPEPDTEEIYGGRALDPSGWNNVPSETFTFDINHFMFDSIRGERNDLDERRQALNIKVSDFYKAEDGLRAKAYVPETEVGQEFLEDYKKGRYGVSIEYDGYEDGNVIKDWKITSGTFHEDPSYSKTKPKNNN
jgi:hypothetical protein